MKGIFYLIPFLLIVGIIPLAAAQEFETIVTGSDFDLQYGGLDENGKMIYKWISKPQRILDKVEKNVPIYKDYKLTETLTHVKLETANSGSLLFNKNTCSYELYKSGEIPPNENAIINDISWTVKGKPASSTTWSNVNSVNNAACTVIVQGSQSTLRITGEKANSAGTFQIVLDYAPGKGIKETMRAYNNNPSWTNHHIGFTEKFQVPRFIKMENQTYDLSTLNNTILSRDWIGNNTFGFIELSEKVYYDFGIGFDNLENIKITWDGSKAYLSLNYLYTSQTVPYQQWFEVDPTFGYATGNVYHAYLDAATGTTCATVGLQINTNELTPGYLPRSADSDNCRVSAFQVNTTTIPDLVTVLSVNFRYDVDNVVGGGQDCKWTSVTSTQPSSRPNNAANALALFTDIQSSATTYVSNVTNCKTVANDYVDSLGDSAKTDLQNLLPSNWFAVGMGFSSIVRDGTTRYWQAAPTTDLELEVTYDTYPPQPPTNLSCDGRPFGIHCTWTASVNASQVTSYYIQTSTNNVTFANRTSVGNITSYTVQGLTTNTLYYARVNATINDAYNTTSSNHASATTDTLPTAPQDAQANGFSDTIVKLNWNTPSSDGGDSIVGYRIDFSQLCATGWTTLVNATNTLNYNHTGLVGGELYCYRLAAWNGVGLGAFTSNVTGAAWDGTEGSITLSSGVVGDVIQLNGTISITAGSPTPVNITQSRLYVDGTLEETRAETISISVPGSDTFDPFWYRFTDGNNHIFAIKATATNASGTVTISPVANVTADREYDPSYFDSLTDPATLGIVNYTDQRFADEDGVNLKVNRLNVLAGDTWTINCILQTNSEAAQTRNQSLSWQGTWRNFSNTGYFNGSWTGVANTHGYITCMNPNNILFTTTSFTNSSLALFGIQLFDDSYGSMLGVPVGIFFLAMAGSMANKRTAPTWIIVVLGMAGTMAAIGFFTLEPLVWGLALVAGMLGVLVNQKVF